MTRVCIIYGFTEGPWQSKTLRKLLRSAGFHITSDVQGADIIIAHSGGCYMVPANAKANLVLLVGLPHWPGRHVFSSLVAKIRKEKKDWWWLKKTGFNAFYLFSRPRQWRDMRKEWKRSSLPAADTNTVVVAIRNDEDYFMHPGASALLAKDLGWRLEMFRGHHDDIWVNPEPYVNLVQSLV